MKRSFIYLVITVISLSSLVLSKKMFQEENTKEYQLTSELEKIKLFTINTFMPGNNDKQIIHFDSPLNNHIGDSQFFPNLECKPEDVTNCIFEKNILQDVTINDLKGLDTSSDDWKSIIETLKNDETISDEIKQCLEAFHCDILTRRIK